MSPNNRLACQDLGFSGSYHLKFPSTNNVFLSFLVTRRPRVMKIVPFDSPYRGDSNGTKYKKLFEEMVVMQAEK